MTAEAPAPVPLDQLHFTMPPVHESAVDERAHRKQRIAGALRLFARFGYEEGVAGHITARDPEFPDCYWANPFGEPFASMTASALILVNGDGQVVEGARHVNQAALGAVVPAVDVGAELGVEVFDHKGPQGHCPMALSSAIASSGSCRSAAAMFSRR